MVVSQSEQTQNENVFGTGYDCVNTGLKAYKPENSYNDTKAVF